MENQDILAKALGMEPSLVPYLPELWADLWALGGSPERIVEHLRSTSFPPRSTRVLELGCGKGAAAVRISHDLDFKVLGIDIFPPFIREAAAWAKQYGVEDLCKFEVGDFRDALRNCRDYDAVVYAADGGVLGDFAYCVEQLRQTVRPGGFIVIHDLFLSRASRIDRPGYEYSRPHPETIRQLTAHGDVLVKETLIPMEELRKENQRNTEFIRIRAKRLAQEHPELADHFSHYVQWEEEECSVLETETISAVWSLQRC